MKSAVFGFIFFVMLSQATWADDGTMTIGQVIENKDRLDSKMITVRGWLPECEPLSCLLYESPDAAKAKPAGRFLSIGDDDPSFDREVAGHLPAFVMLRARLDAECVSPSGSLCFDRVSDLRQVRILRLNPD